MQEVSKIKTASAYAKAWFEAAKEKKAESQTVKEVSILQQSLEADASLWKVVSSFPDFQNGQKELLKTLSQAVKLSQLNIDALNLIEKNGRLPLLPLILKEFINLYYEDKNIIKVNVKTAVALTASQDQKLKKVLQEKLKADVLIDYEIRPEVLGGLSISFNSFLYDDTLASKLKRVKSLITAPQN